MRNVAAYFSKIVLKDMGPETSMACHDGQLHAGLKAGIKSTIHRVQALWYENLSTGEWGFLLVDAKNAFNEIN